MTPIILYDNALKNATITASTTQSGYSVDYLKDYRTFTTWKASHTTSNDLIIDLGAPKFIGAFSFVGHNLKNAKVSLSKSEDGATWSAVGEQFTMGTEKSFLKIVTTDIGELGFLLESGKGFLQLEKGGTLLREKASKYYSRYWKFDFVTKTAPEIAVIFMGEYIKFEFPPEVPTVPFEERIVANSSVSNDGHMLGADVRFHPRSSNMNFKNFSRSFYRTKLKPFWDSYGKWLNPFIYAWDMDNRPDDVFYCTFKKESVMREPLSMLSNVDNFNLNLKVLE